ncbi:hypothetical protein DSM112329_00198 [Paraconexibacter sp. AEG42_29]|uniref:Class I SAM-dependent methyltransferase n=1 Tax=Paraconexibacter sp. AEG42_29 TaxID=2997339 RepID=A0AAU7AP47_9ACTN
MTTPSIRRPDWLQSPAERGVDDLRIAGRSVMERWEQPYMDELAAIVTANAGDILEVGYGMGISTSAVQAAEPASHTILECHPDVARRCVDDHGDAMRTGRLRLLTGFWQDTAPLLREGLFDGILFDTYPLDEAEWDGPHLLFFEEARRLLKPGGVLTYYSDEPHEIEGAHRGALLAAGFRDEDIEWDVVRVEPPPACEYWDHQTIVAPRVRKSR